MFLDHIQLAIPKGKEEESRAFWIGIMGMVEESKPSPLDKRGGCWFRKGGTNLHCGVEVNFAPQRKAHPAFVVDRLEDLAKLLEEKGYPVTWDTALADRHRFYTEDPFGNRLEFMKEGDGFSQR